MSNSENLCNKGECVQYCQLIGHTLGSNIDVAGSENFYDENIECTFGEQLSDEYRKAVALSLGERLFGGVDKDQRLTRAKDNAVSKVVDSYVFGETNSTVEVATTQLDCDILYYATDCVADIILSRGASSEPDNGLGKEIQKRLVKNEAAVHEGLRTLWGRYALATSVGRPVTDLEIGLCLADIGELLAEHDKYKAEALGEEHSHLPLRAQTEHDATTLKRDHLLFDDQAKQIITRLCSNVAIGQPTLIIGEKGIAKTEMARYVANIFAGDKGARFISGNGGMMKEDYTGETAVVAEEGVSVTKYQEGILMDCAEHGWPLVIDEVNLIDPAIIMSIQDMLLKKPGDRVSTRESNGRTIVIKHGFTVIATANEANYRYKSRTALDPAFRDRFDVVTVRYPDDDAKIIVDKPDTNIRLAHASAVGGSYLYKTALSDKDLQWVATVAHASQQLYSKPSSALVASSFNFGDKKYVFESPREGQPVIEECITPRRMGDIIKQYVKSNDPYRNNIRDMVMDHIGAMQNIADRRIMFDVLHLLRSGDGAWNDAQVKAKLKIS